MIVLDASAALELVLLTPLGRRIAQVIELGEETLHAPHLIDLEVLQAVRRFVRSSHLPPARAVEVLADFADLRIERYAHRPLAHRIWDLRDNATAYDGAYLALAEALPATLLTCDAALASVPGARARVEVLRSPAA